MPVVNDYTALLSGNYWNGIDVPALDGTAGPPIIVTFSFSTTGSGLPAYDSSVPGFSGTLPGFAAFSAAEQAQALSALNEWAAASGVIFVEVAPNRGDINFANVDLNTAASPSYSGAGGIGFNPFGTANFTSYPYLSSDLDVSGDVFMNTSFQNSDGTVNYGTLLHEIGHAIGLKHPTEIEGTHDQVLSSDDPDRTIMATVGDPAITDPHLLPLDQQAAAFLYGPSGGSVVTSSDNGSNSISSWTWDSVSQTLTQTAVGTSEVIHGTSVDDVIIGSTGADTLFGLAGNDSITGGDGNDYLYGGAGNNTLVGGKGDDNYYVDSATDVLSESPNQGTDSVISSVSFTLPDNFELLQVYGVGLTATGNNQGDTLWGDGVNGTRLIGGTAADYIVGYDGNDTIAGGGGTDLMYGGAGANEFVFTKLSDAPVGGPGLTTIGDFTPGTDKIDLSAIHDSNGQPLHFSSTGHFNGTPGDVIQVPDPSGGNSTLEGDVNGDGTADFDIYLYGTVGTPALTSSDFILTPLCFLAGTQIATPGGERAVETLAPGDHVRTASGTIRRVIWVGHGRHRATPGRRDDATPVLVARGALAENVPHRDLRITKAHALFLDEMLVPVEFLVNHRSIRWDDHAREVALYHVELDGHDVLLANGAPAESFRDDGNRWLFENARTGRGLPQQEPCARVVTGGTAVDVLWQRLLDRAGARPGWHLTDEPDLHLIVDGQRIEPTTQYGKAYLFRLDALPGSVRLCSRAAAPQELGVMRDPRILGVAVSRLIVWHGEASRVVLAADPNLSDGFHKTEPNAPSRWTNGDATLPGSLFQGLDGTIEIVVNLAGRTLYPLLAEASRLAA